MVTLVNRAFMSTTTTGTGTISLTGTEPGYQSFADAGVTNGATVRYTITEGASWEIGTGTYSSTGPTLARSPSESSSGGAAITLGGEAKVFLTAIGGDIMQPANNLSDVTNTTTARANLGVAIGSDVQAYSSVLANTTASFTTADETKLDYISVTQPVDLDQMETDIAALANGMVYKGDWNAGSGVFPGGGAAQIGWFYYVSGAGTVDGVSFSVGDNIVATADNASTSTYSGNWSKHDQTDAVQSVAGLTGTIAASSLRSALNVEDGADVTDATNVAAAGALMLNTGGTIDGAVTIDNRSGETFTVLTSNPNGAFTIDYNVYGFNRTGGDAGAPVYFENSGGGGFQIDGVKWPGTSGSAGQFLTYDGSNTASWATISQYTNSDVDTHLNTSTATAGQALTWSGSDYEWSTTGAINDIFYENSTTVTANYTITSGKNAVTAGPVTIASGITVTVPSGSRWAVV